MTIGNRILLGFLAITILIIGLGTYGLSQIADTRDTMGILIQRDIAEFRQLNSIQNAQDDMDSTREEAVSRFLLKSLGHPVNDSNDPIGAWPRQEAATEKALASARSSVADFRRLALSQVRQSAWEKVGQVLDKATVQFERVRDTSLKQFQAIKDNDVAGVAATESVLTVASDDFNQTMDQTVDLMNETIAIGQERVQVVYENSRYSTLVVLIAAILLSLLVSYLLRRSIIGPLNGFMDFVENVGRGDLSRRLDPRGRDELSRLGITLNVMVEGLQQLARQSRDATENLNAATAEIRASTQEQAASVEEQLAAVQETAATVDEITHAGSQIGKRAQEVIATAQVTVRSSASGLKAVSDTVKSMDSIREQAEAVAENIIALSEKTQAIGEIIATVNDISERSHLLALNAAIEAAAAGDNGRSFAVVAAEMKTHADQSKEATAQIRSILGEIQRGINASVMLTEEAVKRVAAGKDRTDTTQQTIEEITAKVQESVQTFQQIVASTNQQQLGIEQVMGALQNIRQASQQTAAGTRQLDSAAANLNGLSQQLLTLTERYRI